ncbi:uncharacterized protein LOC119108850 [Pollicipes pollicipes]|uniref:uncharacterized protein LOC119108850 n=1 Tax=Pollicipes pollicipes TaxID=41117 RepID=UPI0018858D92|nr:uncharacterized protein LOC119108850 [Pollicipes pollicipes]
MEEYVQRLHQASGECLLCNWAAANDSDPLAGRGSGAPSSWIPVLVAVALLSAALGAVVMVIVIRCRRWRILPSKSLCPLATTHQPKESPPPPPPPPRPAGQPYLLNTYSEIGEPRRLLPDGTYENAGYLADGPAGGESAGSDPSSAYYSDASAGERSRPRPPPLCSEYV